jgi:hypothetical protein
VKPLAAVLLAGAVLAAVPARGSERTTVPGTDICLYWNTRQIPWTASLLGTPEIGPDRSAEVMRLSFATWQATTCTDLRFQEKPASSSRSVGWTRGEPANDLVLFRTRRCVDDGVVPMDDPCWLENDCSNHYDCWSYGDGVIALTTTSYNSTTGEMIDADIELNAATFYFTARDGPACQPPDFTDCVATDLQNTVTHEIGHVLGLAHSKDPMATMFAQAPLGDTEKRTLGEDDTTAICAMYPAGKPPVTCFTPFKLTPVARSGTGCAAAGSTSSGLLAGAAACLRLLRRREGDRRSGPPRAG